MRASAARYAKALLDVAIAESNPEQAEQELGWFAALGTYHENPWFVNFCIRLLQASPEVLNLLESNPFPDQPPRFIRAVTYDYRFTHLTNAAVPSLWWRREGKGEYLPPISLQNTSAEK